LLIAGAHHHARAQQEPEAPSPIISTTRPRTISPESGTAQPNIYTGTMPNAGVPTLVIDLDAPFVQTPIITNRQGVLVETANGHLITSQAADETYNPASAVKLATALAALRTFGAAHRFSTAVWTTGEFDSATGTITGDLVVSGRDPSFGDAHAVTIARELNKMGIRTVTGDLIVAPGFTLNYSASALRSGERFYDTLDVARRPASATRAWQENRRAAGDSSTNNTAAFANAPSVAVMGAVYSGSVPAGARVLVTHKSSTLADILKILLCYSNNFMADRLGDQMGGAPGLERFLVNRVGIAPADVRLASTSGLGVNRFSPRTMMKIYRALVLQLDKENLRPSDIMPVAGIDPGTLQKRFTSAFARGSVIGKTGTLVRTDGGASALVGQARTASGETLYFVIFQQRGNVRRFRNEQDRLVAQWQTDRGGARAFAYTPRLMESRLTNTELTQSPGTRTPQADEYEPDSN
jgi:D-alanyl-D-alanine carboxypeptidase/D-alanyl-D-alanine-endopeptidase (penicillin-binding protein 4)